MELKEGDLVITLPKKVEKIQVLGNSGATLAREIGSGLRDQRTNLINYEGIWCSY